MQVLSRGGRSLPLPLLLHPSLPFSLSLRSLILSFRAPSPALEAGSGVSPPGKLLKFYNAVNAVGEF